MRRCPECYEIYEEGERFCEVDGRPLLNDPAICAADEDPPNDPAATHPVSQQSWQTGLLGATVGILLCAAAYAVHAVWTAEADPGNQEAGAYSAKAQEPVQSVRPVPARMPEPSPLPSEEESPDPEASPEAPAGPSVAAETQPVAARLNQGPVSTGPKVKGNENGARIQTIILMKDGSSVEVDAAWEDKQGVWYRRGGLVSFVESQLVKAITARAEPKSSANDSAP
jgi:type IV secretory pathway VirB10-like protein